MTTDAPHLQSVTLLLDITFPEDKLIEVASVLEDEATSISWEKNKSGWEMQWIFPSPAPMIALVKGVNAIAHHNLTEKDFCCSDVPLVNWLQESYKSFPPFTVGRFFIHGSHFQGKVAKGLVPLQIDAATAFGSGEHGTTRGCLEALDTLKTKRFRPKNILDMGTGSGILGIAAYKLWGKPTLAIDIDKEATRVAVRHRRANNVPAKEDGGMICATGDGYNTRCVGMSAGHTYDLIIANILAGPLAKMAPDLATCLSPKGIAILSGLLVNQEKEVLKAHKSYGLHLVSRITHNEWRTLVISRNKV